MNSGKRLPGPTDFLSLPVPGTEWVFHKCPRHPEPGSLSHIILSYVNPSFGKRLIRRVSTCPCFIFWGFSEQDSCLAHRTRTSCLSLLHNNGTSNGTHFRLPRSLYELNKHFSVPLGWTTLGHHLGCMSSLQRAGHTADAHGKSPPPPRSSPALSSRRVTSQCQ